MIRSKRQTAHAIDADDAVQECDANGKQRLRLPALLLVTFTPSSESLAVFYLNGTCWFGCKSRWSVLVLLLAEKRVRRIFFGGYHQTIYFISIVPFAIFSLNTFVPF